MEWKNSVRTCKRRSGYKESCHHLQKFEKRRKRRDEKDTTTCKNHERNNVTHEHTRYCRVLLSYDTCRDRWYQTISISKRTGELCRPLLWHLPDWFNWAICSQYRSEQMVKMDHRRMLRKSNHVRPKISGVFLQNQPKKRIQHSTKSYCTKNAHDTMVYTHQWRTIQSIIKNYSESFGQTVRARAPPKSKPGFKPLYLSGGPLTTCHIVPQKKYVSTQECLWIKPLPTKNN